MLLEQLGEAAQERRWGDTEELLAVIVELLDQLLRVTVKVNSKRGTYMPPPLRVRRPGEPELAPAISMGQMARRLAAGR